MISRIIKFQNNFINSKREAYLHFDNSNITYLTSFQSSESWLLVSSEKTFYVTDFRYTDEAKKYLKDIEVYQYSKSLIEGLFDIIRKMKIKTLFFDDRHISLNLYKQIKNKCPAGVRLVSKDNIVEGMRELKDKNELSKIKSAIKFNLKVFDYLKRTVRPGMTESEVFSKLEQYVKSNGYSFSFDPIVAAGKNSCFPHARITKNKIRNNSLLLLDIGIDVKGYKSDLTRMFFFGKIPLLVKEVYNHVEAAQKAAIEKIRPGVKISEVDSEARKYLRRHNLDKYFGHALGHGVGLDIHESPRVSNKNKEKLKEGMVITIEPAVYMPNKFGIRIEDMVLVTSNGCKVLSA